MTATVIDDIGLLVTNDPELGEGPLGIVADAALVIEDGEVVAVERAGAAGDAHHDAGGRCLIPGFVDSHTHLLFAGDRADEFAARIGGTPYEAGGIRITTKATRAAPDGELLALAHARRAEARAAGITHQEIKSGYGLTVESEARLCRLAAELTDDVTFLGAHLVPPEYEGRADDYVRLVCGEMLDACAPHSRWIDVFCERGAFDLEQSRAVLGAGRDAGLGLRVHGNQLGPGPGRAARGRDGGGLGRPLHLPRRLRHRGAGRQRDGRDLPARPPTSRPASPIRTRAARSTPASRSRSPPTPTPVELYDLDAVLHRAGGPRAGMTIDEALRRPRVGGARALRRDDIGRLAPGRRADAVLLDAPSYAHLIYRPGVPLTRMVLVGGEVVFQGVQ